jgi:hypothetical protein
MGIMRGLNAQTWRYAMQARLKAQISQHSLLVSALSFIGVFAFYIVAGSAFA